MTKELPKDITSYDLIKALALLLMIVDHIGYHFFPEEMWFRLIGRLCVPIWFFLIGYSRSVFIPPKLLIGGALIVLSAIVAGQYVFPLDILFTIAIIRYWRQGMAYRATNSPVQLRGWFLVLLLIALPTGIFFEYGSLGALFVLFGFIMRNKDVVLLKITETHIRLFTLGSFLAFFFIQGMLMPVFTGSFAVVLALGLFGIAWLLMNFKPDTYPELTRKLPSPFVWALQFFGRRTLEIYVAHILLLRAVCMVLYPESFGFMEWGFAPPGLLSMFLQNEFIAKFFILNE